MDFHLIWYVLTFPGAAVHDAAKLLTVTLLVSRFLGGPTSEDEEDTRRLVESHVT